MIDYISAPAGFHTIGQILVWDPPSVFEHEWHIEPHEPELSNGEPDSVIRWELAEHRENDTIVSDVQWFNKTNGSWFCSRYARVHRSIGLHLDQVTLPDWMERYLEERNRILVGMTSYRFNIPHFVL